MTIHLSVLDPKQVSSPSSFEVHIGEPARRLMVFSGIAIPEFWTNHDEEVNTTDIVVHLNSFVSSLDQAVSHVGLASIANDETNFLFALDESNVELDASGELLLHVWASILGEETLIHRFGYQVVAHVHPVAARISGTIQVPKDILDIKGWDDAAVAGLFTITANRIEQVTTGPFLFDKLIPVAWGATGALRTSPKANFVDYTIDACPFNMPLTVEVVLEGRLHISGVAVGQVAGPRPVVLTTSQPDATGVDFSVGRLPPIY
jgi:hypothetical protein